MSFTLRHKGLRHTHQKKNANLKETLVTCLFPNPPVLSFTSHLKDSRGTSWNPFYFHSPTSQTDGNINGSCPQERAEQHSPKQCCISPAALGHGQHLARVSGPCQGGWWRASWEKCFLWMTLEWFSLGIITGPSIRVSEEHYFAACTMGRNADSSGTRKGWAEASETARATFTCSSFTKCPNRTQKTNQRLCKALVITLHFQRRLGIGPNP